MGNVSRRLFTRMIATATVLCASVCSQADRILLVPLDSRPAAGQFAQMIAHMANVDVMLPPYEQLGRFTVPGSPAGVLSWLQRQDYKDVRAVVVRVMFMPLILSTRV